MEHDPVAPPLSELPPLPPAFELLLTAPPELPPPEDEEEIDPPDFPLLETLPVVPPEPLLPPEALEPSLLDLQPDASTATANKAAAVLRTEQWKRELVIKTSRHTGVVEGSSQQLRKVPQRLKRSFLMGMFDRQ